MDAVVAENIPVIANSTVKNSTCWKNVNLCIQCGKPESYSLRPGSLSPVRAQVNANPGKTLGGSHEKSSPPS